MYRLVVLLFIGIIAFSSNSFGQVYGILKGKVEDEDGKGLRGASVFIEGTQKGAVVRESDGSYVITGIVAGEYTIRFTFTGKTPLREKVRVSPSLTTTLNVVLKDETIQMEEVVKYVEREIVNHGKTGSMDSKTSDDIKNTAREGLGGIITLSAGVMASGSGFSVRGSRDEETSIRMDGMDISNSFTGGFGVSGSNYYPMVSAFAIEEVQVLKGGFSAEYGDVTSGVINSTVQTGRDDRYDGWVRWRTDLPALYGSQSSGTKVVREGTRFKPYESGEGAQLQGRNENTFEFGTGGPLPFLTKGNTFYLSGKYLHEKNRNASYEIYDPWGNNVGQRPDNGTWLRNITGRLKFNLMEGLALTLGGMFGLTSFESSSSAWLYANNEGWVYDQQANGQFILKTNDDGTPVTNGMPERMYKQNVIDNFVYNYYGLMTHTLSPTSFYEIRIMHSANNDYQSRRVGTDGPGFFSGWEMEMPTDDYMVRGSELVPGNDKIIDAYTLLTKSDLTADGYLRINLPQRNPLSGYYEGQANSSGTHNPWGLPNTFATSGSGGFSFREGSSWSIDGSYSEFFKTGEFDHNFKTGFQGTYYTLYRHSNGSAYDGNPFVDVYDDGRFGGNFYAEDAASREKTEKSFNPIKIGLYAQDQITYKNIIFSPGLRVDIFDPSTQYRATTVPFIPVRSDTGFADTKMKVQISPRLNVAYPITETSNIRLSYGMYFQMPSLNYLYDNFNLDLLRGSLVVGNPNLDAQRTNQYEIEYNLGVTNYLAFSTTIYYKDEYNKVGVLYIPTVPDPYYQYTTSEYGSSRGIEFNLRKKPQVSENFVFELNYNLGYSSGTSSSATSNYGILIDPYTNLPTFPLSEYPCQMI